VHLHDKVSRSGFSFAEEASSDLRTLPKGCECSISIDQRFGVTESLKQAQMFRLLTAIRPIKLSAPTPAILPLNLPQRYFHPFVVDREHRDHDTYCIAASMRNVEKCKQQTRADCALNESANSISLSTARAGVHAN
jgi:hypothetical protein